MKAKIENDWNTKISENVIHIVIDNNLLHNTNSFIASNENEFTKALLDFCLNTSKSYDLGLRAYDFYIEQKLMSSYVKKFMKAIYE